MQLAKTVWQAAKNVLKKAGYDPKMMASAVKEKAFEQPDTNVRKLTYEDSLKILSVDEPYSKAAVEQQFDKLWKINDPMGGGSFYIACKLVGARKVLLKNIGIDPDQHVKP